MARKSFLTSGAKNWYGKPTFSQKKRVRAIKHYIRAQEPQIEVTHTVWKAKDNFCSRKKKGNNPTWHQL